MTSEGLGELKKLINEAAVRRLALTGKVSADEQSVSRAQRRLRLAKWFIIRLFTQRKIPKLVGRISGAEIALTDSRRQLAGCSVEIDFAFDQPTLDAFSALVRSFEGLLGCQRIWDITSSVVTNRFAERTIAQHSITRKSVGLSFLQSQIIDTHYKALYLTNANGNDVYIYPGFVMMRSPGGDFALIDVRELHLTLTQSTFIEEESVPSDSEVIGYTWKKSNKDGARDRRFTNNYQIPIAKYGEIEFRSSTGLYEVYQFSNYRCASTFSLSFKEFQEALAAFAERSKDPSAMPLLARREEGPDDEDTETNAPSPSVTIGSAPTALLLFDWIAVIALIATLSVGTFYIKKNADNLQALLHPFASNQSLPAPAPHQVAESFAETQTTREVVYVQRESVNVRSEPSATSEVVGHEKIGAKLRVFRRQGNWIRVGRESPSGWIHKSLVGAAPP